MKRYYIASANASKAFVQLTEEEYQKIMGDEITRPYASRVYRGEMALDDVPAELRDAVQAVVDAKVAMRGLYSERQIPDRQALNIITGGAER